MRFIVLALLLIFSTAGFGQSTAVNCPVPQALARDPFTSISLTTPWPMDYSTLNRIVSGQDLGSMATLKGITVQQKSTPWRGDVVLHAYLKDVEPVNARFLNMRENLRAFFSTSAQDDLKFVYIGQAHAIDLYLSTPDLQVGYWNKPYALDTLQQQQEFRKMNELLKIKTPPLMVGENSLEYFALPYAYALESIKQLGPIKAPVLPTRAQVTGFPHAIVINELHSLVSTDWVDQMPGADCLIAAGIRKVTVGLEGYAKGHQFTLEDVLRRRSLMEQVDYRAGKLGMSAEDLITRLFPADMVAKILAGQVQDNPGMTEFIHKLLEYKAAGLNVELSGLEALDYNEMGK